MKIGFIGLGIMGSRMAHNLLAKGHDLTVYNRTPAKAEGLLAEGAQWAATPADLGRKVDILFTMLSTPEVVSGSAAGGRSLGRLLHGEPRVRALDGGCGRCFRGAFSGCPGGGHQRAGG